MECYDESLEGSQTDMKKDWNKGQEEEEEEEEDEVQWQGKAGDHLGKMGLFQFDWEQNWKMIGYFMANYSRVNLIKRKINEKNIN